MVTKVSFYGKAVNSLGNEDVRISKRLFMPSSKLRGFESGKIGPLKIMTILVVIIFLL